MRTGITHEHYAKQKGRCYTLFKINYDELEKLNNGQYTIYDFINNLFPFSYKKRELTVSVLETLKNGPKNFTQLLSTLHAKKSTLYLVCLTLQRSGLIRRESKRKPYTLSTSFSTIMREYSYWWENWVKIK